VSRRYTGGKRQREADRDRRKKDKEDRLRQNREQRTHEDPAGSPDMLDVATAANLPEVKLEDVVISVAARPKAEMLGPTKLFIGGLSWDTTTEDLRTAFSNFGNIVDAVVITDRSTGRSRGFGFVTYEKRLDADEAVKQMNGRELDGRALKVNRAES
jgi:RNA recognition motif-containing protein